MQLRLALLVLTAGCRLHFDDLPLDAAPDASPIELTCNVPVRIGDATATNPRLSAAVTTSNVWAAWIDDSGATVLGSARVTGTQATTLPERTDASATYTLVSIAGSGNNLFGTVVTSAGAVVRIEDEAGSLLGGPSAVPSVAIGPHAAAATGNATDPRFAIIGNNPTSARSEIAGINLDATSDSPVNGGMTNVRSTLVNVGDRLAIVDETMTSMCEVKTVDLGVTSATFVTVWGTSGQCTQPTLAYSPARSDALVLRHDTVDNDVNHAIATRSSNDYAVGSEMRIATLSSEARGAGVADGYWVAYETSGTLQAAHVDFAGTVGTVVPLGPVASATGHDVVVKGGEPYAVWIANGLELAHLCP